MPKRKAKITCEHCRTGKYFLELTLVQYLELLQCDEIGQCAQREERCDVAKRMGIAIARRRGSPIRS